MGFGKHLLRLIPGKAVATIVIYFVTVIVFLVSSAAIYHRSELELIREAQALAKVDPLPEAKRMYEQGNICEALEYLDYFMEYDYVTQNAKIQEFYQVLQDERKSPTSIAKRIGTSIYSGTGACPEEYYSALASDLVGIGSIRTALNWTGNLVSGAERDDFGMVLAGVDLVLTAVTIQNAMAAPAKGTVTAINMTHRIGKLPAPLRAEITVLGKECVRCRSLEPIAVLSQNVFQIANVPGLKLKTMPTVISHAKSIKHLGSMSDMVHAFGPQTGKFLQLGKQSSVAVFEKFGKDPKLVPALNQAVQYGEKGTGLLHRVGPSKFMKAVAPSSFVMGVRTVRSVWEHYSTASLLRLTNWIPMNYLYGVAVLSCLITIGAPAYSCYRWRRK